MPSCFPGMDPYIEHPTIWPDFHADLAAQIRAELNRRIQPNYVARIVPHVTKTSVTVALIVPAPVISRVPMEEIVETFFYPCPCSPQMRMLLWI